MTKPKVALFFGAGAEIGYGMLSGGAFALELFRYAGLDKAREIVRRQIKSVDPTSPYAEWLPEGYQRKRLLSFGKGDYERLIASSLEYRRRDIRAYLDAFDQRVADWLSRHGTRYGMSDDDLREAFRRETGADIGAVSYAHAVKVNRHLAAEVALFGSAYFSAFLKLLERHPDHRELKDVVRAFLELLIGTCGQELVGRLNDELFESAPANLAVFDELAGVFRLNYQAVGQTGLRLVLEERGTGRRGNTREPVTAADQFAWLGRELLEDLYARTFDYQDLIDSHYRYLYNPKAEWAKFTRICIFLHAVRLYLLEKGDEEKMRHGPGYYHDLVGLARLAEIIAIGTTNYRPLVREVLRGTPLEQTLLGQNRVFHLNGSVEEFYDPYTNTVLHNLSDDELKEAHRVVVPLLFTQSGVKPMTSVAMARRYVRLHQLFREADLICVVGYAFNGDDGHINGLLRALVEEDKKPLVILHYGMDAEQEARSAYQRRLRLSSLDRLTVLPVDDKRQSRGGAMWYEAVLAAYRERLAGGLAAS